MLLVAAPTKVDSANGIGATSANVAFREVVPALQNKAMDCAVTGTTVGKASGWKLVGRKVRA